MNRSHIDDYIMAVEGLRTLDRQSLEALQLQKLNAMLQRMRAHGETQLPTRVETLEALAALPFTDRTSGTTTAAKRVFYTEEDVQNTIDFFAAGISEMAQPGEAVLITMPFSGALGLGDLIQKAVEKIGARSLCAGWGKSYDELSALVCAEKPRSYIGFPVPLLSLARYMGEGFSIERALISGDVCAPGVFAILSEQLTLYPHYGSREMCLGGAITCPAFHGMHVRENHFIAEIIGDDGLPVPDGQEGELVITTIGMTAMPLLRYRTGDRTRLLPGRCPCGSVTKRIAQPFRIGSDADLLCTFDNALFALPDVIDYRAERKGQTIHIQALCKKDCAEAIRDRAQTINPKIEVSSRICQGHHTPLYPGKRKLIKEEKMR